MHPSPPELELLIKNIFKNKKMTKIKKVRLKDTLLKYFNMLASLLPHDKIRAQATGGGVHPVGRARRRGRRGKGPMARL